MHAVSGDLPLDEAAAPGASIPDPDAFASAAEEAAVFLKAMAHDGRLMILCKLAAGEHSVTELEAMLLSRQSSGSQQLARLRIERIVKTRREAQTIFYSIANPAVHKIIETLATIYCPERAGVPA